MASSRAAGRSPSTTHATSPTKATCRLPSTVARPAPTSSIAWCQKMRSAAKKTPATAASARSRLLRGPSRRSSHHASTPSRGTAYAQRKMAAVEGETAACLTRMAEKAIVSAPAIAIARGRATSAVTAPGIAGAAVRVKLARLAVRGTVAA